MILSTIIIFHFCCSVYDLSMELQHGIGSDWTAEAGKNCLDGAGRFISGGGGGPKPVWRWEAGPELWR